MLTRAHAQQRVVDAFRKRRAVSGRLAHTLGTLGLHDGRVLRDMVLANIIRKAGPERFFLDEDIWAARRQLHSTTVTRIVIGALLLGCGALIFLQ